MDVLSDLLHRARARNAVIRQLVQTPPWALRFTGNPALTVVAALTGHAWIHLAGTTPVRLDTGDTALIRDPGPCVIADDPTTPPSAEIRDGRKHLLTPHTTPQATLGPRTYGDGLPGATTMIRGGYPLRRHLGDRLLTGLPALTVIPAGPTTSTVLHLLGTETTRDAPGQDAVLDRLLDLLLVLTLRTWSTDHAPPGWHRALTDPIAGTALQLLHTDPAHRWTVATLADRVGLSRAAFAARFTTTVGQPPLTYLTAWRMTLAADQLRDTDHTVATIARDVGYQDAFAFSTAFKRATGTTPTAFRHGIEPPAPGEPPPVHHDPGNHPQRSAGRRTARIRGTMDAV